MATAKKRTKKTAAARSAAARKASTKANAKKSTNSSARPSARKKAPSQSSSKKTPQSATGTGNKRIATAKKATAKKATAKKATAKKATAKKATAKKATAKKAAARKTASRTAPKTAGRKKATAGKPGKKRAARAGNAAAADIARADASLFAPFTEGERADALRVLTEDPRLARMASVGRYRVIAVEPVAVKPPHALSGCRAARIVIFDYAGDRSVDGCVDLDAGKVVFLNVSRAQPMLAREEEAAAIAIALGDDRVKSQLSLGEEPQVAMHYWSRSDTSISFSRRSAAVIFGRADGPSLVAVVDLLDNLVCEIVPANQW